MPDECIDDRLGVLARHLHQHHIACAALDQRGDLAAVAAEQQVTFPRNFRPSQFSVAAFPDR